MKETRLGAGSITISGRHFKDSHGRVLDLRGTNVSSSSKVPTSPRPKLDRHTESSYVGRPFSLEEADEHWRRLKSWGLKFIRINVTWAALEHAGPGKYDEAYLDYLRALLEGLGRHGLVAYLSIHQDVWSRYSGGSGAPGWTLQAAGFDLSDDGEKLALSGAAFLDGIRGGRLEGERGLWPTGYSKLACATMNTLFWGGSTFAPSFTVDGHAGSKVNVQEYLQEAFLRAVETLAETVGDLDSVLGIELMNEPDTGYIGLSSIHEWDYNIALHLGDFPSALQSFSMGAGHPTRIPHYVRSWPYPTKCNKMVIGNETGANAWTEKRCIWEREGVWRWSDQRKEGIALQDDYFVKSRDGNKVDFYRDHYFPFVKKWNERIGQTKAGEKMRMVCPIPNEFCPTWPLDSRPTRFVYSPHWYDLNALFKKEFGNVTVNVQGLSRGMSLPQALYYGRDGARRNYALQIKNIVEASRKELGEVPVIIGESGVPMDLNHEEAFKTGNFEWQERMMDSIISAMESSLVGFNLWAYNPDNRDDIGDDWNAENFSWYSAHNRSLTSKTAEKGDLDAGGRLLNAIVRPYAMATAGIPQSISFDYPTSTYSYRFTSPHRPATAGPADSSPPPSEVTELFIPKRHYREGQFRYTLSSGGRIRFDHANQRAYVWFADTTPPPQGRSEKVRRIDLWVPDRARGTGVVTSQQVRWFIFFSVLWALVAWWAQRNEIWWDRKLGFTHSRWGLW